MKDKGKTREQLMNEPVKKSQRIAEPKKTQSKQKKSVNIGTLSEEWYQLLFNNVSDAVFVHWGPNETNMPGTFIEVNEVACNKLGYTREELLQMRPSDIDAPETISNVPVMMKRLLKDKQALWEGVHVSKDHQRIPVEIHNRLLDSGGRQLILSTVRDITERKQADEMLRDSEERFRAFMDNMRSMVIIKDKELRPLFFNRSFMEMFPGDEWLGKLPDETFSPEIADSMRGNDLKALSEGFVSYEEEWTDKDGSLRFLETRKFRIDQEGKVPLLGAIITDITNRKQVENELKRHHDHLEELLKERSKINDQLLFELVERKRAESALIEKSQELENHVNKLEELNAAMKFLLKQRDEDKGQLEERVILNVKELLLPYLEALKKSPLDAKPKDLVSILESNLNDIISPFAHSLSSKYMSFTPREIQVANLIRKGKSTKEIANIIGISNGSIIIHRNHIRKKLGIISKKINLRSHLMSLS